MDATGGAGVEVEIGVEGEASMGPIAPAAPAESCVLVIFGITGDLSRRKLIPALYHLKRAGALPDKFAVVGVSRSGGDAGALREQLHENAVEFSRSKAPDPEIWRRFAERIHCVQGDVDDPDTYARLDAKCREVSASGDIGGNRLYYLAVAPSIFGDILKGLDAAGLVLPTKGDGAWSRVIVEKPFGFDLKTAVELNELVSDVLEEEQTYRIDHYLGKETVQNILVFRFANSIFEPLWNRAHIERVEVTAAENLLVTGRGAFYDQTGVVRDIVQNHLLQILALVTMEPPVSLAADAVRDAKVNAIRSIRPIDVQRDVVFGQYDGYHDVDGVAADSRTPTFVAIKVHIDNWRWHGVPIYLRAGKAMSAQDTEVAITFRPVPGVLFGADSSLKSNQLVLQIQPNDGIDLTFASKVPGEDVEIGQVTMRMTYAGAFDVQAGDAYERLLLDGMRGDATLFARRDEVEEAWALIDPVISSYEDGSAVVDSYEPGRDGPEAAAEMMRRDGQAWRALGT